jgi:heme exporter protein D
MLAVVLSVVGLVVLLLVLEGVHYCLVRRAFLRDVQGRNLKEYFISQKK